MSIGTAYTRAVSPRLAACETSQGLAIDVGRAALQHAAYEQALTQAGFTVERLAPLAHHPDGVFVEDTALLLGDDCIVARPGAASRAGEAGSTAEGLARDFTVHRLAAGRLDGGDVLAIGRTLYVGRSARTDEAGIGALAATAGGLGYRVVPVPVSGCLHLKSAATFAGPDAAGRPVLLHNPDWVSPDVFADVEPVAVAPGEDFGANVLRAGAVLMAAADSPRTSDALRRRGYAVVDLDISEIRKADAALTCMSLISERSG